MSPLRDDNIMNIIPQKKNHEYNKIGKINYMELTILYLMLQL